MEALFEIVFEFVGEILLQVVVELLAEMGWRSVRTPFVQSDMSRLPWVQACGYALFGAIAGALSLWLAPTLFIHSHSLQVANLLITPFFAGAVMAALGVWRARHDQVLVAIDKFGYGFVFAIAMALVRFQFGH